MVEPHYNFGPFTLVPARRQLLRDGIPVEIRARSLGILLHLVANAGAVIEKADLMRIVWEGRVVEDNNLTVQISALRRLLGTDAKGSPYVRTLPGRGYVFVADVSRVDNGAGSEAAAQPSTPAAGTGLPQFHTAFIGRETELADLTGRLQRHRLSVVTGIGGVGKTRLVIKVATDLMPAYSGGVVFVDLARVPDGGLVGEAVAAAVRAGGGYATADEAIVSVLRTRTTLLVLDNGEHVTAALARLCLLILAECPLVTLLVIGNTIGHGTTETAHTVGVTVTHTADTVAHGAATAANTALQGFTGAAHTFAAATHFAGTSVLGGITAAVTGASPAVEHGAATAAHGVEHVVTTVTHTVEHAATTVTHAVEHEGEKIGKALHSIF